MKEESIKPIVKFLDENADLLKNNNFDKLFSIAHSRWLGTFLYNELGIKFWKHMSYIPDHMLDGSGKLEGITIPDGVTKIGKWAFSKCTSLQLINIPDSITEIDDCAFYKCTSLQSIIIPNIINRIGMLAFYNCPKLIIRAPKNSYAIAYAKENNIKYEEI